MATPQPSTSTIFPLKRLPAELRNRIYEFVVTLDKPIIPTAPFRGSCTISPLTRAFQDYKHRPNGEVCTYDEYQSVLEHRMATKSDIVNVNVINWNFTQLEKFVKGVKGKKRVDAQTGLQVLAYPTDPFARLRFKNAVADLVRTGFVDLEGPFFAVRIMFTKNLDRDQRPLDRWLRYTNKEAKAMGGHLRFKYQVVAAVRTKASEEMISHLNLVEEGQGQMRFIQQALQKGFVGLEDGMSAPRLDLDYWQPRQEREALEALEREAEVRDRAETQVAKEEERMREQQAELLRNAEEVRLRAENRQDAVHMPGLGQTDEMGLGLEQQVPLAEEDADVGMGGMEPDSHPLFATANAAELASDGTAIKAEQADERAYAPTPAEDMSLPGRVEQRYLGAARDEGAAIKREPASEQQQDVDEEMLDVRDREPTIDYGVQLDADGNALPPPFNGLPRAVGSAARSTNEGRLRQQYKQSVAQQRIYYPAFGSLHHSES